MISKRAIGRTGVEASILGFGCMRLPLNGPKPADIDRDQAIAMIRKAADSGVNYFDTAYPYHPVGGRAKPGASEPLLAEALSGGYREKVYVATKLPTWLVESRKDMDRFLDEQLERLKVNRIDFYLAHNLNASVWDGLIANGLREFFDEAVKDGRIGFPAFSFHDNYSLFETIVNSYDWAFAQIQYNYLDVNFQAGRRGVELANSKGMGLVVMEPLRGGSLVNMIPETQRKVLSAAKPGWSLPAWGLNWLWNQPELSLVLSGMSSLAQLEENLSLAESWSSGKFLSSDEEAIGRVRDFFMSRSKTTCTGCGYCMPCPQGVDIPKNLGFLNQYFLFEEADAKDKCKYFYNVQLSDSEKALNCVACHDCEEKCPQHIFIPNFLEETAGIYSPS